MIVLYPNSGSPPNQPTDKYSILPGLKFSFKIGQWHLLSLLT